MRFNLHNQIFHVKNDLTVYHLCNAQCNEVLMDKLIFICTKALADDKFSLKHCFEIDDYLNKPSTLLFQFFKNNMNIIIMEVERNKHATMGYSLFGDIVLCPRRVFVDKQLRNRNIYPVIDYGFGNVIMEPLEDMFKKLGVKYITTSFNKTRTGTAHFRTYLDKQNLKKIITHCNYFTHFNPICPEPINMFGNQQYVIYKKIENNLQVIPDLSVTKFTDQVK